jgi:hypothetical protein
MRQSGERPIDRGDIGRLSRCGREPSDRECKERNKSVRLAARSRYNTFTLRRLSHGGGTIHGRKFGEKFPRRHGLKKPTVPMTLGCSKRAAQKRWKP